MSVNDYLKNVTSSQLEEFNRLRSLVYELAPDAEEVMSYGMPTFDFKGKHLLHFGAFKDHMSLFPTSAPVEAFKDELKDFKTSRGTIQYSSDHLVSNGMVRKLLQHRLESISHT